MVPVSFTTTHSNFRSRLSQYKGIVKVCETPVRPTVVPVRPAMRAGVDR
jgi:hypothetical protein